MANVTASTLDALIKELEDWRLRLGNAPVGLDSPFSIIPDAVEVRVVQIAGGVGQYVLLTPALRLRR